MSGTDIGYAGRLLQAMYGTDTACVGLCYRATRCPTLEYKSHARYRDSFFQYGDGAIQIEIPELRRRYSESEVSTDGVYGAIRADREVEDTDYMNWLPWEPNNGALDVWGLSLQVRQDVIPESQDVIPESQD
eukprot:3011049-Rhodomonas_salina.5